MIRIQVFIASPGDVTRERYAARRAIERINKLLGEISGFHFAPTGWEQIPPAKSARAQEAINPYVDSAKIFIGILYQRFGTPTGIAESGTEEEFFRVEKRWNEETPKPAIWIFFKTVAPDRLSDPGEQLKNVLRFKKRIEPTVLYKEFTDERALQENIEEALSTWVHEHYSDYSKPNLSNSTDQIEPYPSRENIRAWRDTVLNPLLSTLNWELHYLSKNKWTWNVYGHENLRPLSLISIRSTSKRRCEETRQNNFRNTAKRIWRLNNYTRNQIDAPKEELTWPNYRQSFSENLGR